MTDRPCGTRARYQQGCHCLLCCVAEASYRAQLRRRRAQGLPILGQHISASEAWARIRKLKEEGFSQRQINGRRDYNLPTFGPAERVRLSTLIRLRLLCHRYLIADNELPMHHPGPELPPSH